MKDFRASTVWPCLLVAQECEKRLHLHPLISCIAALVRGPPVINWPLISYLWDENQTKCHGGAEDNKERCKSKRGILRLFYHQCRRNTNDAQDDNIVHRHPNIARVV